MRKICDKKEKIHKKGEKSPLEPGRASGAGGGIPGGSQTRWGKAGAPERGGLPGVERRVSTSQAEAAPAVTEGQHESSGGRARRNGGSARLGRGAAAMGAKMPLLTSQAGHGDHCGKESSRRNIFLRNNREETRQATSAMGKASQTSSSTPVSEKRYATGMRMIS